LVTAGPRQPAEVHALAHLLNAALGAIGTTVTYPAAPDPTRSTHLAGIAALAAEIAAGRVSTLVVIGGNPAYDAPADLDFADRLAKVATTIRLGLFDDETSALCRWHLARAHALESWGDARAWDGTVSVVQPLIEPLYGGRTPIELVATMLGEAQPRGYELVRATLAGHVGSGDVEAAWRQALRDGVLAGSALPALPVVPRSEPLAARLAVLSAGSPGGGLELVFTAGSTVRDGRFANNAWLQELPDPLTKLTWDNAALLAPADATRLGVTDGDVVTVTVGSRALDVAVAVLPGQPAGSIALPLGYGRRRAGRVGNGVGFDTYTVRTSSSPHFVSGAAVAATGRRHALATTQDHHGIDKVGFEERGRRLGELIREGTLAEFLATPGFAAERGPEVGSAPLFRELAYDGEHQWGMAIDLSACIGCNACTVACQAENNIPVVGKEQVLKGREMHWIRLDRYFAGKADEPKVVFQPLTCQHCENAPCEQVCPVAATVHSNEGLNQMVYNRCVGTRYCSNNCPYKVRRFNFFNYYKSVPQVEKMVFNPEVTIRARGVMEKCTFCVQRIETAKIAARNDNRPLRDGEVVPACAQTCPTRAITFGDLRDESSAVSRQHRSPRAYGLLAELDVKPRNLYLAKLRNPAPGTEESS
jgi:molybdopterin-containing oxidoreductase family iron-sulfur binding subunit